MMESSRSGENIAGMMLRRDSKISMVYGAARRSDETIGYMIK